jgi:polysaccharide biosynthesis/export protein
VWSYCRTGMRKTMCHRIALALLLNTLLPAQDTADAYLLGSDDQILVRVFDVEEFGDQLPLKIDPKGNISLPLLGTVKAAGLTAEDLEVELVRRLRGFVKDPHVKVRVAEFRAAPVSVLGAVNTAGVQQVRGRKTLYEILSQAGGLKSDAGDVVTITRPKVSGVLPLPNVRTDDSGNYQIGEVNSRDLLSARSPLANIVILPNDVISVPRAELVYVMGQVTRSGGFVLDQGGPVTLIQALSMAGGPLEMANLSKARLLRVQPGTNVRQEIDVDIQNVLRGKGEDLRLRAEDVLYIPHNMAKAVALRALEAATMVGTQVTVWRAGTRR